MGVSGFKMDVGYKLLFVEFVFYYYIVGVDVFLVVVVVVEYVVELVGKISF